LLSRWGGREWFPSEAEEVPEEGAEEAEAGLVVDSAVADLVEADLEEEVVLAEAEEDLLVEVEVGDDSFIFSVYRSIS
jgi:hypothetical protein